MNPLQLYTILFESLLKQIIRGGQTKCGGGQKLRGSSLRAIGFGEWQHKPTQIQDTSNAPPASAPGRRGGEEKRGRGPGRGTGLPPPPPPPKTSASPPYPGNRRR